MREQETVLFRATDSPFDVKAPREHLQQFRVDDTVAFLEQRIYSLERQLCQIDRQIGRAKRVPRWSIGIMVASLLTAIGFAMHALG